MVDRGFTAAETRKIDRGGPNAPTERPEDSPAPYRAATDRTGHWTATEEAQARYLVAAMTARTVDEVTEPLSRLLHELRYRHERNDLRVHVCGVCGMCCCTYKGWGSPADEHTVPMPCDHAGDSCGRCGGEIVAYAP